MTNCAPVLDIQGLSVSYGQAPDAVEVLTDVTLRIAAGEALGLVGESGSGKSTIAGAVLDLLPPGGRVTNGSIGFEGRDLRLLDAKTRRALLGARIGTVFQDPFTSLNPSLPIGFQVAEPIVHHLKISKADAFDRARQLLADVGLSHIDAIMRAFPHQLSGGMKQRVMIATAIACDPALLILDEPTTALDVTVEAQLLELLANLRRRRGVSLLFISHNLSVVRQVCDRVCVLYAGQVLENGPTGKVLETPSHPYTRGLIGCVPRIAVGKARSALSPIPGRFPDLRNPTPGCRFLPRCGFAEDECRRAQSLETRSEMQVRCWKAGSLPLDRPKDEAQIEKRPTALPRSSEIVISTSGLSKRFYRGGARSIIRFQNPFRTGRLVRLQRDYLDAVKEVSLDVRKGEIVGLVGESGSGKSTFGRALLRLIEPSGGRIVFGGTDVTDQPRSSLESFRRGAQIVFQNPDSSLNPRMRVGDIIARPLRLFRIAADSEIRDRVASLLKLVQLSEAYADRYPHQLSGGEKQRVGIARALASEPRFVVCDEAVSALDVSVQAAIINLIEELRDRLHVGFLFISHDISVVSHLADRIAVMYRGTICEVGSAEAVLSPPYHPYTWMLLSSVPQIDRPRQPHTVQRALAIPAGSPSRSDVGCPFYARCPVRKDSICAEQKPPILQLGNGHALRCHQEPDNLLELPTPTALSAAVSAPESAIPDGTIARTMR